MASQIESVLSSSLNLYSELPKTDKQELWCSVLRYIFRVTNASEFAASLRDINKDYSSKKTRLCLLRNGIILKNVKLFTYASVNYIGVPRTLYKINEKDEAVVLRCLNNDKKLAAWLRKYLRMGYKPLSLPKMDRLVGEVITDIETYTSKFVHRKLRFVIQSTGIEAADIKQDLYSWGAYSIYKSYPKIESFNHAINIAKRAIHNRGINLIMESTSQSRQRYIKNDDGTFGSKNIPLHSLVTPTGTDETLTQCNHMVVDLTGRSANGKAVCEVQDDFELKLAVQAVYNKVSPRFRKLMKLWSGQFDEGFSKHLGEDNDDWFEESDRKEYMVECVKFLKIDKQEAVTFYKFLKNSLKEYKDEIPS